MTIETGIYAIRHLPSGRVYIGATKRGFAHRWKWHQVALRNGCHSNPQLQRAWHRGCPEDFSFIILEPLPPETLMASYEQYWIDRFILNGDGCYNKMRPWEQVYRRSLKPRPARGPHPLSPEVLGHYMLVPADVAATLKVDVQTVQTLLKTMQLPGYRFGRAWRVKNTDLEAFIQGTHGSDR